MKKKKSKKALKPKQSKIVKITKPLKVKKIAVPKPPKAVKLPAKEIKIYKQLLQAQKKEFIEELNKNLADSKKIDFNEVKDSVDLASDTYDTEFLHNLSDTEKRQIEEIDYALEKIEHGAFGPCEFCGKKINKDRLKVLPQAKLCFACQTKKGG
ncbi:MAG: TraR/DksA C4-type zinc finger protein [Candidatus Firestonebacteria bacterium]